MASQQKAEAAQKAGKFKDEIMPVEIPQKKGDPIVFDTDEFIKAAPRSSRWPACARPSTRTASVTAGNASGLNDGAAAVLVMTRRRRAAARPDAAGDASRPTPSAGLDPAIMGMGPVPASQPVPARRPAGRRTTST